MKYYKGKVEEIKAPDAHYFEAHKGEPFGLPHGGAILGIIYGTIILIWRFSLLTGINISRQQHLFHKSNHLWNTDHRRLYIQNNPQIIFHF
jgi:hypothetical protein